MKNASALATLVAVFITSALSQSLATRISRDRDDQNVPARPRYIFRIPVFPGTGLFSSNPDLAELNPPFGTIVEVFHTTDGRPLDKEEVITFFHDALEHKGWKEGIFKRQNDEAYLSMATDVFEALPDGTRIQVAGDFHLWVAPHDGMVTVYLRQWRLSSIDQVTHNSLEAMVTRLIQAAPKAGYRATQASSGGRWKTDFENEYLVDRVIYALMPGDAQPSLDAPEGALIVTLLVYRDADSAAGEKARLEKDGLLSPFNVAVKGKIVITIEGNAAQEKRGSILRAVTLP